ncbi:MAG: hypothetical protein ACOCRK_06380 [bacterium]
MFIILAIIIIGGFVLLAVNNTDESIYGFSNATEDYKMISFQVVQKIDDNIYMIYFPWPRDVPYDPRIKRETNAILKTTTTTYSRANTHQILV